VEGDGIRPDEAGGEQEISAPVHEFRSGSFFFVRRFCPTGGLFPPENLAVHLNSAPHKVGPWGCFPELGPGQRHGGEGGCKLLLSLVHLHFVSQPPSSIWEVIRVG